MCTLFRSSHPDLEVSSCTQSLEVLTGWKSLQIHPWYSGTYQQEADKQVCYTFALVDFYSAQPMLITDNRDSLDSPEDGKNPYEDTDPSAVASCPCELLGLRSSDSFLLSASLYHWQLGCNSALVFVCQVMRSSADVKNSQSLTMVLYRNLSYNRILLVL